MKLAITNFYNVRNLIPTQLPLSTAMWDPKWYHDNQGPEHVFRNNKGVINGMRCYDLVPGPSCSSLCRGSDSCTMYPEGCAFLEMYRRQLETINFAVLIKWFQELATAVAFENGVTPDDVEIVLLVYEKIDNPCSERWPIIDFFHKNGVEIRSF